MTHQDSERQRFAGTTKRADYTDEKADLLSRHAYRYLSHCIRQSGLHARQLVDTILDVDQIAGLRPGGVPPARAVVVSLQAGC